MEADVSVSLYFCGAGEDSPCQGEMSRRDRGGRELPPPLGPSAHTGADEVLSEDYLNP